MYRYSVDNAVTYTSEDFVLFRESPFAAWMERLTLENPDHGIPPDVGSNAPRDPTERQDDVADTLRAEGRDVALIDWDEDESQRRSATLDAMRRGVEFIVNGQLALGPLSGAANLLMRTSGYSDLGGFLYIPCDTQDQAAAHSAFRLCFLADLLHSLQGQLPPQLLIIRDGADLESMRTEEHIYHYRAVKQRFMESMRSFRKHRMPDPAESAHFGRWTDCAHEVLRQRALREDTTVDELSGDAVDGPLTPVAGDSEVATALVQTPEMLVSQVRQSADGFAAEAPQVAMAVGSAAVDLSAEAPLQTTAAAEYTLAEQALMLDPGAYIAEARESRPGFTPNLVASGYAPPEETVVGDNQPEPAGAEQEAGNVLEIQPGMDQQSLDRRAQDRRVADRRDAPEGGYQRRSSDVALQNLQFIGSDPQSRIRAAMVSPPPDILGTAIDPLEEVVKPHPLDTAGFNISVDSVVDRDIPLAPPPPPPVLETESALGAEELEPGLDPAPRGGYDRDDMLERYDNDYPSGEAPPAEKTRKEHEAAQQSFSDSLITSESFPD